MRRTCLATGLVLLSLLSGCAREGLRRTTDEQWFLEQQRSALTSDQPSARTGRVLRRADLASLSRTEQIQQLMTRLDRKPDPETCLAVAELCYAVGKRRQQTEDARYLASALLFSYAYLFGDQPAEPFDPAFRLACDLYNRSLARIVQWRQQTRADWAGAVKLRHLRGTLRTRAHANDLTWTPDPQTRLEIVYDYAPIGLPSYRTLGLGVPVLAIRPPPTVHTTAADRFRPRETPQAVPLTILIRIRHPLATALGHTEGEGAQAELFDPTVTTATRIGATLVPLETDTTTAVAYMLSRGPQLPPIEGVLNVAAWKDYAGLFMMQPYRPGRTPIVLVHGLLSTPEAWGMMANEILGDPLLRERYQVWYFRYPTGAPLLYSAAKLRESLRAARSTLDPAGTDAALDRMVIVGRSLGGLLTQLQVQNSDERLWGSISAIPIDELDIEPAQRALLTEVFEFHALPFVTRVVFLVTPHRGAELADAWFARFFAANVRLPQDLTEHIEEVNAATASELPAPNAITGLSATSPILQQLAGVPIAPHVRYHSIIANRAGPRPGGSDGIVPFDSASLDGADSQVVVQATHMESSAHPGVIAEVLRILHEHLPRETATRPVTTE